MSAEQSISRADGVNQPKCAYNGCTEAAWDDSTEGYCIFHASQNGRDEGTARAVWEKARARVASGCCDFKGWHFPQDPDGNGFKGLTLVRARFDHAVFNGFTSFEKAVLESNPSFSHTLFYGATWFEETEFGGSTDFQHARFFKDSNAIFNCSRFKGHKDSKDSEGFGVSP